MASGTVMPLSGPVPTATASAELSSFDGGSTPAEQLICWLFDDSTDEHLDFHGRLENYDGGGLTVRLPWTSDATSGDVVWNAAIRRVADDAEDLDTSHTYAFNSVTATTASVAGEVDYTTVTFTDGADMDSVADGEVFILRIRRDADNGSDDLSGDAELHADWITLIET